MPTRSTRGIVELDSIRAALEDAASGWSDRRHTELVGRIVEQARSGGLGSLGERDTTRALRQRCVGILAFAASYRERHPDGVDELVAEALSQRADLEEVGREAGELLLREGNGVGAVLRFRIDPAAD